MGELDVLYQPTQKDIDTLSNIIIFGHICEAICKAGIEIQEIISRTDLLNDFVNTSLEYYGYSKKYKFDLSKIKHSIQIKEINLNDMEEPIHQFVLATKITETKFNCNGILGFTQNSIFIQSQPNKASVIDYPDALNIKENQEIKPFIVRCLSWILLASAGFYLDRNNIFCNFKPDFKFDFQLVLPSLGNISVMKPYDFNCFFLNE